MTAVVGAAAPAAPRVCRSTPALSRPGTRNVMPSTLATLCLLSESYQLSAISDQRSTVRGPRSTVNGQRSTVSCQLSADSPLPLAIVAAPAHPFFHLQAEKEQCEHLEQ